jgi:predicted CopG family antitoxin
LARIKTIAVTETVWERLKEIMRREQAHSMSDVIARLVEHRAGVPQSKFGAHRRSKVKLTQEEHEAITRDLH